MSTLLQDEQTFEIHRRVCCARKNYFGQNHLLLPAFFATTDII